MNRAVRRWLLQVPLRIGSFISASDVPDAKTQLLMRGGVKRPVTSR